VEFKRGKPPLGGHNFLSEYRTIVEFKRFSPPLFSICPRSCEYRTIVEFKHYSDDNILNFGRGCEYRTIVEFKQISWLDLSQPYIYVSIEPSWNLNYKRYIQLKKEIKGEYRTIVEFKLVLECSGVALDKERVSIEPSWNLNLLYIVFTSSFFPLL